jgi:hypothetical protein
MAPVSGTIETNTYYITGVDSSKYATLPSDNPGTDLISGDDSDIPQAKWLVTKQGSNKYVLSNIAYGSKNATVGAVPKKGDLVVGKSAKYEWIVQETLVKSQYLISPSTDDGLFWFFPTSDNGAKLKLTDSNSDAKSKWQFTYV